MKSVSENYVAHQIVLWTIADIERGIELEIACHVAGEPDCRRIFRAALEIDLHAPPLIEIVGITEDCFVFVAGMNGPDDHLVMLGVIASFDVRLRIYSQVRRPIYEPNGKKIRLLLLTIRSLCRRSNRPVGIRETPLPQPISSGPARIAIHTDSQCVRLEFANLRRDRLPPANPASRFDLNLSS